MRKAQASGTSPTIAKMDTEYSDERKHEFRGPMWLDDIDPELEVTPLLDSGMNCQDESARLLSRDPEYWVEHMGREKTLSAALQLQHDAGLILSNVQILQQLVTALHGASANVMGAVRGHQPFLTQAMWHALPSGGVVRAAHYMTAMGLWRPPIAPGIQGSLPVAACKACMSSGVCFPEMPQ